MSNRYQVPSTLHSITVAFAFTTLQCRHGYPRIRQGTEIQQGGEFAWCCTLARIWTGTIPAFHNMLPPAEKLGKFNGEKKIPRIYVYDTWFQQSDLPIHLFLDKSWRLIFIVGQKWEDSTSVWPLRLAWWPTSEREAQGGSEGFVPAGAGGFARW